MTNDQSDLRERIETLESRVSDLEELAKSGELEDDTSAMREFVEEADPDNHIERAVVIGRFLERFSGQKSFQTSDMSEGYETCRVPLPANMSDVLQQAEERELIMPTDSDSQRKSWKLTAEGEELVEKFRRGSSEMTE